MAATDVLLAKSMGWNPGTILVCTERVSDESGSVGFRRTLMTDFQTKDIETAWEITRIEGNEVFAKLLYEDGHRAEFDFDEPLCLTTSEWTVVTKEALEAMESAMVRRPDQR